MKLVATQILIYPSVSKRLAVSFQECCQSVLICLPLLLESAIYVTVLCPEQFFACNEYSIHNMVEDTARFQ